MWSRNPLARRAVLAGAVASLAACTLTPAYGPGGTGTALHGRVALPEPDDVDSFALNRRLIERLGHEDSAAYRLEYRLTTASVPQAITADEVTTRYSVNGTADFSLTDILTGAVITQGRVSSFTSYSAVGTTIATISAERDAHERLMVMLADRIVTWLLATGPRPQQ
ncbi:LPS assembly lipoprotein LptE [Paracoccus aerodenitrificans]|uniref:LPS assembly lipoprotein LptE n=1 Tax=Paracoccus aerodenitrificans TaxID=3017781 RepID=UPI0022F0ACE9|nr:LPS assembly lipoprotein LptE [Paracoccus aerodenitrificans]WBU64038.1 LPS assembly lipoprotein LptE [Paracoccus aerodenitrificans]